MREYRLQLCPNGRWTIILTGISGGGVMVDTGFVDTLDEALAWIKERGPGDGRS